MSEYNYSASNIVNPGVKSQLLIVNLILIFGVEQLFSIFFDVILRVEQLFSLPGFDILMYIIDVIIIEV